MTDDIAIEVKNVSKNFVLPQEKVTSLKSAFTSAHKKRQKSSSVQRALKDVSFTVKKGEFFGIVGRNGSGKSTMLKILAGIYQPSSGAMKTHGKLVPFIELGVGFNPELTGRENIYLNGAMLGFSRKQIDAMYADIVAFAELERFIDQKLKNYSSGMQVRLAFSMATRAEADILLVDEVLAVGDADFQKKCFRYFKGLKKNKKTVVFVSHDMNAVQEYCDRAILIEQSEIVAAGSSHDVAMAYTRMFLEQDSGKQALAKRKQRWGDGKIRYDTVAIAPLRVGDDEELTITTTATAQTSLPECVLGFKLRNADDDAQLLGTNTKLKNQHIGGIKQGGKVTAVWKLPNVLNSGTYYVDVAIQSPDYDQVFDWWEQAATLLVERSAANPYPIHPIISLTIKS